MAILETENLKKIYGSGAGEVRALDGINMSVETGEFVGPSGSGKSTLLHMLGGLDRPTSGKVFVDDRDIFSLKDEALTIFRRRKIGFVFQAYNLVPVLNVYENIVLPVELDGRKIDSKGVWTPIIVLDPGHSGIVAGGYEPLGPGSSQTKSKDTSGTQGVATGVEEYKLTLNIGLQLRSLLRNRGCKVVMTRTNSKVALSCIDRARIANKAKADAYIRLHANGSDNSYVTGAMTICTTKNSPYIASMYKNNKSLSNAVLNAYVSATGCRKEYIWETDSMSGNNWSKVPTTLIEMGYMSNPSEDRLMQQTSYQKKMVRGIAKGIENYLTDLSKSLS